MNKITDEELAARATYARQAINDEVLPKPKQLAKWFLTAAEELQRRRKEDHEATKVFDQTFNKFDETMDSFGEATDKAFKTMDKQ